MSRLALPSLKRNLELIGFRWRIRARYFPEVADFQHRRLKSFVISTASRNIKSIPEIRDVLLKAFAAGWTIAVFIAFGVQSVSPVREVFRATLFFSIAALLAALGILFWEELRPSSIKARIFVVGLLELLVFFLLSVSLKWVAEKADDVAWPQMQQMALDSQRAGSDYRRNLEQQRFVKESIRQPAPVPAPARVRPSETAAKAQENPKPDISLVLVYPKAFSLLLVNTGKVVLHEPKYFPVLWNLDAAATDKPFQDPLPIPTWTAPVNEFIRKGESIGPEPIMSLPQVHPLVKDGDRIMGVIYITCVDCERTKWYWVYAVQGEGGWIAEIPEKSGSPQLNKLGKAIASIRANPEAFFSTVKPEQRIPIVDMP